MNQDVELDATTEFMELLPPEGSVSAAAKQVREGEVLVDDTRASDSSHDKEDEDTPWELPLS